MKRLIMLTAAFAAVMPLIADTETVGGYTWTYRINGNEAEIFKDDGYGFGTAAVSPLPTGFLEIPSTLGGKPVARIGCGAFTPIVGEVRMFGVTLPDSVTSIGQGAFERCIGLTSVTIPSSVTNIEDYAFIGCTNLTLAVLPTRFYGYLPDHVFLETHAALMMAFSDVPDVYTWTYRINGDTAEIYGYYSSFASTFVPAISPDPKGAVTIPSTLGGKPVANIGARAFHDCDNLTSVTIPGGVTNIESDAFLGCSRLTSVTIPDSVTSIGDLAFYFCSGLRSFAVAPGNLSYKSASGLLLTKDGKTLVAGVNGDVTIPDSVTDIGKYAFYRYSDLTSVTIPDSVTNIGACAFSCCSGLTSVTIPGSMTSIGYWAFGECSGLTSVTIPDSVTNIGEYAFGRCSGLTSVTIPDSVTSIGKEAFEDCSGLTSVTIPDSVTNIGQLAFALCSSLTNVIFEGDAPQTGQDVFYRVASDCTAYVSRASTGWNVSIPGRWNRINIRYSDEIPVPPAPLEVVVTNFVDVVVTNTVTDHVTNVVDVVVTNTVTDHVTNVVDVVVTNTVTDYLTLTNFVTQTVTETMTEYVTVTNTVIETNLVDVVVTNTLESVVTNTVTDYLTLTNFVTQTVTETMTEYVTVTNTVIETNLVDVVVTNTLESVVTNTVTDYLTLTNFVTQTDTITNTVLDHVTLTNIIEIAEEPVIVPEPVQTFEPAETFTGSDKSKTNGVIFDPDGTMRGVIQVETAKASAKGVKVKGFIMLEDGKKVTLKTVTVPIKEGRLEVETAVGKLGKLNVVICGDGFKGTFGAMKVVSADVGKDAGVLTGSLTLKYIDAKGKVVSQKIAVGGVTTGGTAAGTVTPKGGKAKVFAAEFE